MEPAEFCFTTYLADLPPARCDELYESPWTCRAVLRAVLPMAKQYVLRLLHVEEAVPVGAPWGLNCPVFYLHNDRSQQIKNATVLCVLFWDFLALHSRMQSAL